MSHPNRQSEFEKFVVRCEPRLRRALVARFGPEQGREMTVNALAVGWEKFDRVRQMDNPVGYLYTVGSRSLATHGREISCENSFAEVATHDTVPNPDLVRSLAMLSAAERTAVLLVHGFGYTQREASEVLDLSASTVGENARRGLDRLRARMSAEEPR